MSSTGTPGDSAAGPDTEDATGRPAGAPSRLGSLTASLYRLSVLASSISALRFVGMG